MNKTVTKTKPAAKKTAPTAAPAWAHVDPRTIPHLTVTPPGPQSKAWHDRCSQVLQEAMRFIPGLQAARSGTA